MQTFTHYFLHLVFPLGIAWLFFRSDWKRVYLIFLTTMLVDVDHLLADPIFEPRRCSIQFHYLHSYYAMVVYVVLLFFPKPFQIVGLGLLMHMATDLLDCLWTYSACPSCLEGAPAIALLNTIGEWVGI